MSLTITFRWHLGSFAKSIIGLKIRKRNQTSLKCHPSWHFIIFKKTLLTHLLLLFLRLNGLNFFLSPFPFYLQRSPVVNTIYREPSVTLRSSEGRVVFCASLSILFSILIFHPKLRPICCFFAIVTQGTSRKIGQLGS